MNNITCSVYPEWYEDQQKDEYMECLAIGRSQIKGKLTTAQEYIIEVATKIAINNKYGKGTNISQEELDNIKKIHKENLTKIHITPPDGWYSSELNPLNRPYVPEILPHNNSSNFIEDV